MIFLKRYISGYSNVYTNVNKRTDSQWSSIFIVNYKGWLMHFKDKYDSKDLLIFGKNTFAKETSE